MVEKMKPPVPKEQKVKPPREVEKPKAVVKGKGKGKTR